MNISNIIMGPPTNIMRMLPTKRLGLFLSSVKVSMEILLNWEKFDVSSFFSVTCGSFKRNRRLSANVH